MTRYEALSEATAMLMADPAYDRVRMGELGIMVDCPDSADWILAQVHPAYGDGDAWSVSRYHVGGGLPSMYRCVRADLFDVIAAAAAN